MLGVTARRRHSRHTATRCCAGPSRTYRRRVRVATRWAVDLLADPHPARPAPRDDEIVVSTTYELFWSLSFALTTSTWRRIGGFCTLYRGYGGEDTDFAQTAAALGVTMRWVGGANAFHQFHPVSDPPTEHLEDIVRNAAIFHRRWGWWPMTGWLQAFEERGLITRDDAGRPQLL